MLQPNRVNLRFLLNIVVPAIAVFAGTVAIVLISLHEMANAVDETELAATRRTAIAALQATAHRLANTHQDYARWDEAARKLYGRIDMAFVKDTYISSTEDPVFFDTAYLVDKSGRRLFAYHGGKAVDLPVSEAFGPDVERMIAELPSDGVSYDVRSGFVRGAFGLAVAAVGPVTPFASDTTLTRHEARFLVLAKSFNDETVKGLASDYRIDGLKFVPKAPADAAAAVVMGPYGNDLATLTWDVRQPGSEAFGRVRLRTASMLALLAATLFLLVALAARGLATVSRSEARARHAATHDALSGLPNRSALVESLGRSIAMLDRGGDEIAILYLDLDGFKQVNDMYGHEVGDQLLRKVAVGFELLTGDRLLVRLGGDEFAVVIDDFDALAAGSKLAEHLIRFFAKPFDIGGRIISIGTSVGVAVIKSASVSAQEALRRADVAMYQAKQQGRNRVCVFDDSLDALRVRRIAIAADLRRALASDALTLAYQPIYDAGSGRVSSVEALLRWPRDDDKPISPAEFIPIAEGTGLIDELGQWTLRRACRDARAWPGIRVSVNVSPAQFQSPNFAGAVAAILAEVGLPANRLEIEVTETYFIAHPDPARNAIEAIRALGVMVALDDFGTGYSSIGYLRSFSFDKLKLDRSLIVGIDRDGRVQELVQATIGLANALHLSVTAEGVETEEEAAMLRLAGCRELQGFYFGRPSPASEITALLGADARLAEPQSLARIA